LSSTRKRICPPPPLTSKDVYKPSVTLRRGLRILFSPDLLRAPYRDSFAEILRHKLKNPLTGILGNAELLLAEVRRQKSTQFSESSLKRLETIAALAVRMRETVRRLSQACEAHSEQVRSV